MILAVQPGWDTAIGWIAPYQIALCVAMLAGAALFSWQMHRLGVSWSRVLSSLPLAVVLPVTGARILDIAVYSTDHLWDNPVDLLKVLGGGLSSHGAFLGLALLAVVLSRLYRVPVLAIADRLVIWGMLGVVAARAGDHFHDQGVGIQSDLPWAIGFQHFVDRQALARHPVNYYEIGLTVLLIAFTFVFLRILRGRRPGFVAAVVTILYFIGRLFIDGVREVPLLLETPRIPIAHLMSLVAILLVVPIAIMAFGRGEAATYAAAGRAPKDQEPKALEKKHRSIWAKLRNFFISLVVAGALGGLAEYLAIHVQVGRRQPDFPLSILFILMISWSLPVLITGLIGGKLGDLLSAWSMRVPRRVLTAILFIWGLWITVGVMLVTPMEFSAVIMVLFAVLLPAFHETRDLVVYVTGSLVLTLLHVVPILLIPQMRNQPLNALVFVSFGIAVSAADRARCYVNSKA